MEQQASPSHNELTLEEELALIRRGAEEVFPEEELAEKLERSRRQGRPLRVKFGIDPTTRDIHLGHLVPVLRLRQFQRLGHQAVLIIGDYTATVGDPSGRNKARPQLTHEQVMENARDYTAQLFRFLDPERTEVVYNGEWFGRMRFHDVIRLLSRMTVARMLEREDFQKRFRSEVPIGLHELVYPLMQGYDSVQVRADIELGGTDQKFNILVGRDLQKEAGQSPQVGICYPILLGLDGKEKMSKSLGNYIALADPPEEMYGKTMSIPDSLMEQYYELLTTVSLAELARLREDLASGQVHPRDAKRRLAREIVSLFYGEQAAWEAEAHFDRVHRERQVPEDVPEVALEPSRLNDGRIWIAQLLLTAGLAKSTSEARRLIVQGGVRINGELVANPDLDWTVETGAIVQVGRRRFARVVLRG
ncbi:MAG: tyrosine--tRNA ligase [Firmicutes bacterium]|nr:tyrosine--tRNA ligase [Bacillota bacterium]